MPLMRRRRKFDDQTPELRWSTYKPETFVVVNFSVPATHLVTKAYGHRGFQRQEENVFRGDSLEVGAQEASRTRVVVQEVLG